MRLSFASSRRQWKEYRARYNIPITDDRKGRKQRALQRLQAQTIIGCSGSNPPIPSDYANYGNYSDGLSVESMLEQSQEEERDYFDSTNYFSHEDMQEVYQEGDEDQLDAGDEEQDDENKENDVDPFAGEEYFVDDDDEGEKVKSNQNNYEKLFPDFDITHRIVVDIHKKYNTNLYQTKMVGAAGEVMFHPDSIFTASQAHAFLSQRAAEMHLNNKNMDIFLDTIKKLLPTAVLPAKLSRLSSVIDDHHNDNGSHNNSCYYKFHHCICGKTVYVGDNADCDECNKCHRSRYTGDIRQRTAIGELNYRSLSLLICDVLHTKWFYEAINYKAAYNEQANGLIFDITQGSTALQSMQEMHANFEKIKQETQKPDMLEVSLLLSAYFDGAQLYDRKSTAMWPLMVSILNLPPPLRVTRGKGFFLLCLHSNDKGHTDMEKFILEQFVNELLYLHNGFEITVNSKLYFIQARLIMHCYDSKGLEGVMQVQGANSYAGCPLCGLCEG